MPGKCLWHLRMVQGYHLHLYRVIRRRFSALSALSFTDTETFSQAIFLRYAISWVCTRILLPLKHVYNSRLLQNGESLHNVLGFQINKTGNLHLTAQYPIICTTLNLQHPCHSGELCSLTLTPQSHPLTCSIADMSQFPRSDVQVTYTSGHGTPSTTSTESTSVLFVQIMSLRTSQSAQLLHQLISKLKLTDMYRNLQEPPVNGHPHSSRNKRAGPK